MVAKGMQIRGYINYKTPRQKEWDQTLPEELSQLGDDVHRSIPFDTPDQVMELEAPSLKRPVLLVHGLVKHADYWLNMKNWLCSNPENRFGGVIRASQPGEFLRQIQSRPDAKVFSIEFSDNTASPVVLGGELRQALATLRVATNCPKTDLITHSQGALDAREAIAQGERGIGHLCMIAPPNQGSYMADLALWATQSHLIHLPKDKLGAVDYLRVRETRSGEVNNPQLDNLNRRWSQDLQHVDSAHVLASYVAPTADRSWTLTNTGDLLVTAERAHLEGTPLEVAIPLKFKPGEQRYNGNAITTFNHEALSSNALAYRFVGEILKD